MTDKEALKLALEALQFSGNIWHMDCKKDEAVTAIKEALAQPEQERNFCARCGKRTADLTVIHTCTPPQEKNT
jgi:NAD-dependent SIR2 family protein deacetylase